MLDSKEFEKEDFFKIEESLLLRCMEEIKAKVEEYNEHMHEKSTV